MAKIYQSVVPNHSGLCKSTWMNDSKIDNRMDGGKTGFFRLIRRHWLFGWVKHGKEFHGIVKNGTVHSTGVLTEFRDVDKLVGQSL